MKKRLCLFPLMCIFGIALVGCNNDEVPSDKNTEPEIEHVHTFSNEWSNDDKNHWHNSTCGHAVTSDKASHSMVDTVVKPTHSSIGYTSHICSVCGYKAPNDNYVDALNTFTLEAPANFRYDANSKQLKWSIVDHATAYVVCIGLDELQVTTNYIDIAEFNLAFGKYEEKVRAVGNDIYASSSYCNPIEFELINDEPDNSDEIDNLGGSMKKAAFRGEQVEKLDLYESINVDDLYYLWYFELGIIYDTPIYSSWAYRYDFEGTSLKITFDEITEEKISTSKSESIKTIDSTTEDVNISIGFSEKITKGTKAFFKDSGGQLGFSQHISAGFSHQFKTERSNSESVTNSYETTYKNGYSINIPFSESNGFKKGNSYRVTFFEPIRAYGVLIYDVENNEYSSTYDTYFIPNNKSCIIEESENGIFEYEQNKTIEFNLDDAKKIALNNIPVNKDSNNVVVKDISSLNTAMKNSNSDTKIRLLDDITVDNDYVWDIPKEFNGILNGNGHSIKNLKIGNGVISNSEIGVYGFVGELNGTIENIKFENLNVNVWKYHDDKTDFYLGAICGIMYQGAHISRIELNGCTVFGEHDNDTKDVSAKGYIGGLVGYMLGGSMNGCKLTNGTSIHGYVHVSYDAGSRGDAWCYTGGFVGCLNGGSLSDLTRNNSENTTVLSETSSGGKYSAYHCFAGGIVGYNISGTMDSETFKSLENGISCKHTYSSLTANSSEEGKGAICGN